VTHLFNTVRIGCDRLTLSTHLREVTPMKLGYTILYVPDVMQAIEHYERCFGISRRAVNDT